MDATEAMAAVREYAQYLGRRDPVRLDIDDVVGEALLDWVKSGKDDMTLAYLRKIVRSARARIREDTLKNAGIPIYTTSDLKQVLRENPGKIPLGRFNISPTYRRTLEAYGSGWEPTTPRDRKRISRACRALITQLSLPSQQRREPRTAAQARAEYERNY